MTADVTVLVADDSLVIRAVVRAHLEEKGYAVVEAEDGLAAVERCARDQPDVVLLDIEMPGLDGYQVLARLKTAPELRDIPVVFLTSRSGMDDVVVALDAGAHDYLRKPFEPPELVARVAAAAQVKKLQDQLRQRNDELDRMTRTDALTGLFNRRHLDEELVRQYSVAYRNATPVALLLLDIDHFKTVNDTYGHPAGDAVLQEFGRRLGGQVRAGDVAGRWGGEEFLVVLPGADLPAALAVAERIRRATSGRPVLVDGMSIPLTVSAGCALGPLDTPEEQVARADAALYEAKVSGRNRTVAQ
ncbi:MAG TPA: diguanylate cyclase [Mycobacteriales bacterium]|nr:diguanylate cyclase [Mycobacteriales bacterium]